VPLEEIAFGTAEVWLARARSSLALAAKSEPAEIVWEDLCNQAQQAAEKAIKAVYRYHRLPFRFTHDVQDLGAGLERRGIAVPECVRAAVVLSPYAVDARYPGPFEPATEEDWREALASARAVVEWAASVIE
jgi:HEPN domain-containing protein